MSLGADFGAVDDLDPSLTFLSGENNEKIAFLEALARRYTTPQLGLFYDDQYGLDLRMFLSDTETVDAVIGLIEAEARKDPRVADCSATIENLGAEWRIKIVPVTQAGETFILTLLVSQVSVEILNANT